jgi:hypothetical protein
MSWIIDHIPIWAWVVATLALAGVAWFYLGGVLLPIWNLMPKPLKIAIGGTLAAIGFYLGGRYRGRANAEEEDRRRNAEALQKRKEVDDAVSKLPPGEAESRLRNRWSSD